MARDYTNQPADDNHAEPFTLTAAHQHGRKRLATWAGKALAAIKPWAWDLDRRLARTWKRNRAHSHLEHSKERGRREARLARSLARLQATNTYRRCEQLRGPERFQARALTMAALRLVGAGDWCKPRSTIDRRTGEVRAVLYLPEDTWSAETCLAWIVRHLDHFERVARAMAGWVAPHLRPREQETVRRGSSVPSRVGDIAATIAARWGPRGAGQPELPATT